MIEQVSQNVTFLAFFTASKLGKPGLTVTVDIRKINKTGTISSTAVADNSPATAVIGGLYMFVLQGVNTADIGDYVAIFKTADTTVDQQHIPSLWTVGRLIAPLDANGTRAAVGLASANLDTQVSNLVSDSELAAALAPVMKTASYTAPLDANSTRSALGLAAANLDTQLSAINTKIPANIATAGAAMTLANDAISAATVSAGGANKIADRVWEDLRAEHTTPGTFGEMVNIPAGAGGVADWTSDEKTAIRSILGVPTTGTTPVIPTEGVLDAIKDKTDTIVPMPAQIDANIIAINGITVTGSGVPGTDAWRPA